jgi:hypothetical protein
MRYSHSALVISYIFNLTRENQTGTEQNVYSMETKNLPSAQLTRAERAKILIWPMLSERGYSVAAMCYNFKNNKHACPATFSR